MSARRKRTRRARPPRAGQGRPSAPPPTRTRGPRTGPRFWAVLALSAAAAFLVVSNGLWLAAARSGEGRAVEVEWPADGDRAEGVARLAAAGLVDRPLAFRALLLAARPFVRPAPGLHLLADSLSPVELLRRLARLASRQQTRVVVPEGLNRFQIAERLEAARVCSAATFRAASATPALLDQLGIPAPSAEGYLFPATYDLLLDTPAETALTLMVGETRRRLASARQRRPGAFERLSERHGWSERDVLTLASMVEKEAARKDELPLIASVFFNRLEDPTFLPPRMLQSDPTAAYGCLVSPGLESCRGFVGKVVPGMLRDAENAYNTYRHPGLPPGPIANPGSAAVDAVLAPAATRYRFFVAAGDGRHVFTERFEDHEAAIRGRVGGASSVP